MSKFLEVEKNRYQLYKRTTSYLSERARQPGEYREKPRSFCVPQDCAEENLFAGIRAPILDYFSKEGIKWHDGVDHRPSNHLCSSQVCCVNFLYSFANKPEALAALLRPVYPNVSQMLPTEKEEQYVSMEWIGEKNYLGERTSRGGERTRGANFTSVDGMIRFKRDDGLTQTVLIEWKYTESYSSIDLRYSQRGTDRTAIYRHLYINDDFPLHKEKLLSFESLFYEPFYQLLRQQLLANEIERYKEAGADIVTLLHITPAHNHEFGHVTSPELRPIGDSVVDVWKKLVVQRNRFQSISVEELFSRFPAQSFPEMDEWWEFIIERYPWFLISPARQED